MLHPRTFVLALLLALALPAVAEPQPVERGIGIEKAEPTPVRQEPPSPIPPRPARPQPAAKPAAKPAADSLGGHVTALALNVRAGPGVKNRILGVLVRYDEVRITDRARVGTSTWYEIDAAAGYVNGWVNGHYLAFGVTPRPEPPPDLDYGAPETPTLVKGSFQYLGVRACQKCHMQSTGRFPKGAYPVWRGHFHSSALDALKRGYTTAIAQRFRGVEDPVTDWRCRKCHVTAYGADPSQLAPSYRDEDGVGCEVCHGPGSAYANVDHGPSNAKRYDLGFYKLTNLREREQLCTRCHNPLSPTYKPFNVMAFSRAIRHWADPDDAAYFDHATEVGQGRVQPPAPLPAPTRQRPQPTQLSEKPIPERPLPERKEEPAPQAETLNEAEVAAALERRKESGKAEIERQQQFADAARLSAKQGQGVAQHLLSLPDIFFLNSTGETYETVRFTHGAHSATGYVPGVTCATCHHTQKGDEKPEKCSACHGIGGKGRETEAETRATHSKEWPFPKQFEEDAVSCVACHEAQNLALEQGKRSGKEAPTSCTACHKRKTS